MTKADFITHLQLEVNEFSDWCDDCEDEQPGTYNEMTLAEWVENFVIYLEEP